MAKKPRASKRFAERDTEGRGSKPNSKSTSPDQSVAEAGGCQSQDHSQSTSSSPAPKMLAEMRELPAMPIIEAMVGTSIRVTQAWAEGAVQQYEEEVSPAPSTESRTTKTRVKSRRARGKSLAAHESERRRHLWSLRIKLGWRLLVYCFLCSMFIGGTTAIWFSKDTILTLPSVLLLGSLAIGVSAGTVDNRQMERERETGDCLFDDKRFLGDSVLSSPFWLLLAGAMAIPFILLVTMSRQSLSVAVACILSLPIGVHMAKCWILFVPPIPEEI